MRLFRSKERKQDRLSINDRSDAIILFVLVTLTAMAYFFLSTKSQTDKYYCVSLIWYYLGLYYLFRIKFLSGLGLYIIYMFFYVQCGPLMQGFYSYYTRFEPTTVYVMMIYNFITPFVLLFFVPRRIVQGTQLRQTTIKREWVWMLFFVGCIFMLLFYYSVGSIPMLNSDAESFRVEAVSGRGFLLVIANASIQVCNAVARDKKQRLVIILLGGLLLLGSGYRMQFLTLIIVAFLVSWVARGRNYLVTGMIVIATTLTLYALLGLFRANLSFAYSGIWKTVLWRFFVCSDNFNRIVSGYPSTRFQYGLSLLNDLSVLLPGAQQTYMMKLKTILGYNFAGGSMTPSVFGEGYYNWGRIGSVIWANMNLVFVIYFDKWAKKRFQGGMYYLISFTIIGLSVSCFVPTIINLVLPVILVCLTLEKISMKYGIRFFNTHNNKRETIN